MELAFDQEEKLKLAEEIVSAAQTVVYGLGSTAVGSMAELQRLIDRWPGSPTFE